MSHSKFDQWGGAIFREDPFIETGINILFNFYQAKSPILKAFSGMSILFGWF